MVAGRGLVLGCRRLMERPLIDGEELFPAVGEGERWFGNEAKGCDLKKENRRQEWMLVKLLSVDVVVCTPNKAA